MSSYRSRPKGQFIQKADWQDLFLLTEEWRKNLEFYAKDIDFLEHLMDTYFVKLLLRENLDELREIQQDFYSLNAECAILFQRIQLHLTHLKNLIEDPFKYDSYVFRSEHEHLEDEILRFEHQVKTLRRTVFDMVKDVLINEKPKYLWKYN